MILSLDHNSLDTATEKENTIYVYMASENSVRPAWVDFYSHFHKWFKSLINWQMFNFYRVKLSKSREMDILTQPAKKELENSFIALWAIFLSYCEPNNTLTMVNSKFKSKHTSYLVCGLMWNLI